MMNSDNQQNQLTYQQAREIVLAMIRIAIFDLDSSDPLIKKEARDWLVYSGLSLAEEVRAGISLVKMIEYIHETEKIDHKKRMRRFQRNTYENRSIENFCSG